VAFPEGFLVGADEIEEVGGELGKLIRRIGRLPDGRIGAAKVSRESFEG
jgi:hypothetical protein